MLNQILCGDCLEIMRQIPDGSVDMILCDLPYGVTARNKWDSVIPFDRLWEAYKRVAKINAAIVLTAVQPFSSQLVASNPKMFRYEWIWVKNKVTGFLNANRMPLRQHESVLVFYQKLPVYNPQKTTGNKPVNAYTRTGYGSNYGDGKPKMSGGGSTERFPTSILNFNVVNNDSPEKCHPTQKPISLFEYLIRTYTNEGMTVLDNCIGSGTTALACLASRRNFIGIEIEEQYCEIARKRLRLFSESSCKEKTS